MGRWTKIGAIQRMQENVRLQEILAAEPELTPIMMEAMGQRRG